MLLATYQLALLSLVDLLSYAVTFDAEEEEALLLIPTTRDQRHQRMQKTVKHVLGENGRVADIAHYTKHLIDSKIREVRERKFNANLSKKITPIVCSVRGKRRRISDAIGRKHSQVQDPGGSRRRTTAASQSMQDVDVLPAATSTGTLSAVVRAQAEPARRSRATTETMRHCMDGGPAN